MALQPEVSGWWFYPPAGRCRVFPAMALAAILCSAGCRRQGDQSPNIALKYEITPQPVRVGPASVTLELQDAAARPVAGARITLEGDMSHAGMAPVFGEANEVAPGRYQGQLTLAMGGDWVVLVHALLPTGQRLERQIAVSGVEAK